MKKLIVLAVASLVATSANAAEMKWSGSAGWRYEQTKDEDNMNSTDAAGKGTSEQTTKAHNLRANLGATGGWENVEWGFGVRTQGTANDDHVGVQNNGDLSIGLEQAWFRYLRDFGSLDMSVTIGRQKNVLAYDSVNQTLFDNDVRWDGAGWQFKFGMFGLNAAQYILGAKDSAGAGTSSSFTRTDASAATASATSESKFTYLLAVQPYMMWKFSDEIETMLAVGYYLWSDDTRSNGSNGGVTDFNGGTTNVAVNPGNFNVHNPKQWHFLNTWTLPYNLSFQGELVLNKEQKLSPATLTGYNSPTNANPEVGSTAWSLGLTYGALQKAQDFTIGYAYGTKGVASVINTYSYENFAADNKGHMISAGYALADNFHIGGKFISLKEKEKLNFNTGEALAGNQEMKSTYWQLTAGVLF